MARRGRPRKIGHRDASGRLKRPTAEAREKIERDQRLAEMRTVLAQPHRQGSTDQLCESALGRFVTTFRLRRELYDAAIEYGRLMARWRAAKGIPTDVRLRESESIGSGDGPSDETVRGWEKQIARIELAVGHRNYPGFVAMRTLVLDDRDPAPTLALVLRKALYDLAVEMRFIDPACHPFH